MMRVLAPPDPRRMVEAYGLIPRCRCPQAFGPIWHQSQCGLTWPEGSLVLVCEACHMPYQLSASFARHALDNLAER